MIDYYAYNTSNGQRGVIALEEAGLAYKLHPVNLVKGEHKSPDYLKVNPRGTIPALVDPDGSDGQPIILTQTFSILYYIAQKSNLLLPTDTLANSQCMEWCSFFLSDVGSAAMQSFYLRVISKEKHPQAAKLLTERAVNFLSFADQHLSKVPYFAGSEYSLADIMAYPGLLSLLNRIDLNSYPHLSRWKSLLEERPAIVTALGRLS